MPKQASYKIMSHRPLAKDVYVMELDGPTDAFTAPGQFVNIGLPGFYLRRPISVCAWGPQGFTIIYKVVGNGTRALSAAVPGQQLDILTGLGNGFWLPAPLPSHVVLIGGGVGVPPLYGLAQTLLAQGVGVTVALGFATGADVFYTQEFAALGCGVQLATEDGSLGQKGYVTGLLPAIDAGYYYTCGPLGMLRGVHSYYTEKGVPGQLSFEERMGCGFGACMGCSCKTVAGPKRICKEGPVLSSQEVMWE